MVDVGLIERTNASIFALVMQPPSDGEVVLCCYWNFIYVGI